jgi:hypothetical protein
VLQCKPVYRHCKQGCAGGTQSFDARNRVGQASAGGDRRAGGVRSHWPSCRAVLKFAAQVQSLAKSKVLIASWEAMRRGHRNKEEPGPRTRASDRICRHHPDHRPRYPGHPGHNRRGFILLEQKNGGTSRKGHVNAAVTPDGRTDKSGKVSPLERTKLGRRFVEITKHPHTGRVSYSRFGI